MRFFQGSLDKFSLTWLCIALVCVGSVTGDVAQADEPAKGATKLAELGGEVALELVYISPGKFMMGSTPAEKKWATSEEGGAVPGTDRESFEGEPRLMQVKDGFWMGRTAVTVGQFRRFADVTDFITDAERQDGMTQCFMGSSGRRMGSALSLDVNGKQELEGSKSWHSTAGKSPCRLCELQ